MMDNVTELEEDTENINTRVVASEIIVGTGALVMSQMMFTILGTLANNLVLITLKDLPDISATTYHILLANISFTNLITCTLIKPAFAVYIGYSYAKVKQVYN